jgi:hypothetical protein
VQPDQGVVGKGEGGAEVQRAVQQRTGQGPPTRERQSQHRHDHQQQGGGQGEPEAGAPQGRKLAVAEPDGDPVAAGEQGAGDEAGERHPLAVASHRPTLRWAIAIPNTSTKPSPANDDSARRAPTHERRNTRGGRERLRTNRLTCLIIRLIIQTIQQDPSGSDQIDEAPNVSRPDPSGADQIDAEHQATDLAVKGQCD